MAGSAAMLSIYEHFKVFREYVNHEDKLVSDRLLWNINIQGFLFATYAFSLQKLAEVEMDPNHASMTAAKALYGLIWVLPAVGTFISLTSYKGVRAAQLALRSLDEQWKEILDLHYSTEKSMVPNLLGGGHSASDHQGKLAKKAHLWGFRAPRWFPRVFIASWISLFAIESTLFVYYFLRNRVHW